MMKKIALIFIILLFLPFLNAETQTLGGVDGYPPNEDIPLAQTCTNCTFVNITTIKLGNGTLEKFNVIMTKDGTDYNYTLDKSYVSSLGEYIINWCADPDGTFTCGNYNLFVRKNGLLTTAEAILYFLLIVISLLGFCLFLFYAIQIPYTDDRTEDGTITRIIPAKGLKLLSIWFCYGFLLWFMNLVSAISTNFVSLDAVASLMTNLYLFLYWGGYVLTILILSAFLIETYKGMLIPIIRVLLKKYAARKK
jgi:hypothetical protein